MAQTPARTLNAPSDSGFVAEMLSIKDIGCDYVRTNDKVTVVLVKIYVDGREDKREPLPIAYPNFKTAMTTCGEYYDKMIADKRYAIAYQRDTVSAKR